MNKRTTLLIALFLLLGVGAFFALQKKKTQGSTQVSWDMDFAVTDTSQITRIFLADRLGRTALVERDGGHWVYNKEYKARQTGIDILLQTIQKVNVKYIPPEAAEPVMIKSLASEGIKVEVYGKDKKLLKCYYVGGVTNDETGTYMMMDGAEQPYVTHIPSFVGGLRGRYMLGDENWRDKYIFEEKPESIQSITVEYPQQRSESFRLEKIGEAAYDVKPFYSTTPARKQPMRKGAAESYLLQYERLGAEAFENTNPLRDSIISLVPFVIVTLKKTDGAEKQVRFWPVEVEYERDTGRPFVSRYFAYTHLNDFMLTQDRVFGKIFRGYGYFFDTAQPF